MSAFQEIKSLFESAIQDLKAHPDAGKGTATTIVASTAGLASRIEDGAWRLVASLCLAQLDDSSAIGYRCYTAANTTRHTRV